MNKLINNDFNAFLESWCLLSHGKLDKNIIMLRGLNFKHNPTWSKAILGILWFLPKVVFFFFFFNPLYFTLMQIRIHYLLTHMELNNKISGRISKT